MAEKLDIQSTVITSKIKNFFNQVHRSKSLNPTIPFEQNLSDWQKNFLKLQAEEASKPKPPEQPNET